MPNRSLGHFDLIVMGAGSAGACAAIAAAVTPVPQAQVSSSTPRS